MVHQNGGLGQERKIDAKADAKIEDNFSRDWVAYWLNSMGENKMADRFQSCGEGGRGFVGVCPDGHEIYHAFGCESRICPRCAARRSRALKDTFMPVVSKALEAAPAGYDLKHIVMGTNISMLDYAKIDWKRKAIKPASVDALREIIKLYRGFVVDTLKDYFEGDKSVGFAVGIEFGASLCLHFHILVLSEWVDWHKLQPAWVKNSLGRGYHVDIKPVENLEKAVGYVTKYVTKPLGKMDFVAPGRDLSDNQQRVKAFVESYGRECVLAMLAGAFKGVRRFQEYGAFYGQERDLEPPEVCTVCGKELAWIDERTFLDSPVWSEIIISLKTNKSVVIGESPPEWMQKMLF